MSASSKAEFYSFTRRQWFTKEARMRRAWIDMSIHDLRQPLPYWRLIRAVTFLLVFIEIPVTTLFWIFTVLFTNQLVFLIWFIAIVVLVSILFFAVMFLYSWVEKHKPDTPQVQVGDAPLWTSDFTAGATIDAVSLPTDDSATAPAEPLGVELIGLGTVKEVPHKVAPVRMVVIAARLKAREQVEQGGRMTTKIVSTRFAGRSLGKTYVIPCKPEPYVAGDMNNHVLPDWLALAKRYFPGVITDWTIIVLALEPYDPLTWEVPPGRSSLQRQIYELRARNRQISAQLDDYTLEDGGRRGRFA